MNRTILLTVACALLCVCAGCERHESQTVVLKKPLFVSSEWVPISLPNVLPTHEGWVNEILLSVPLNYQRSVQPWGLRSPDGDLCELQAQLVTTGGAVENRKMSGFWGEQPYFDGWGRGQAYSEIRLRSTCAVKVSEVTFHDYDPREVKR
jgi:hypothetical protein